MNDGYEDLEALGSHHPIEVSVTVAQAEERERGGIPLPISGDPETTLAKELLNNRRARRQERAAAPVVETEAASKIVWESPTEAQVKAVVDAIIRDAEYQRQVRLVVQGHGYPSFLLLVVLANLALLNIGVVWAGLLVVGLIGLTMNLIALFVCVSRCLRWGR